MGRKSRKQKWKEAISAKVTKLTPEAVQKLREAFAIDCNVREACFYAQIAVRTFYYWIKKNPELLHEFRHVKQTLPLKSKHNIANIIQSGNVDHSWRFLEKHQPKKYGEKLKVEHSGQIAQDDSIIYPEDEALRQEFKERLRENIKKRREVKAKEKSSESPQSTQSNKNV